MMLLLIEFKKINMQSLKELDPKSISKNINDSNARYLLISNQLNELYIS